MAPKIVFVTQFPAAADSARELAPKGFELIIAEARGAAYNAALEDAEYLVGFVDMLVDPQLYQAGPNLRLIQLLSAGYDRADIPAARKAGVPISNNGGANAVAVSEHAIMLMLAGSRQLVSQHANVALCIVATAAELAVSLNTSSGYHGSATVILKKKFAQCAVFHPIRKFPSVCRNIFKIAISKFLILSKHTELIT